MFPRSFFFIRNVLSSSKSPLFSTCAVNQSIFRYRPISMIDSRWFGDDSSTTTVDLVGKSKKVLNDSDRESEMRTFTDALSKEGIEIPPNIEILIRQPPKPKKFRSCSLKDINACTEFVLDHNPIRISISEIVGEMETWTPPKYLSEAIRIYCKRNRGATDMRPLIDFVLSDIIDWYNISTRDGSTSKDLAIYREMPIAHRRNTTKLKGIVDYAIGDFSECHEWDPPAAFSSSDRSVVNVIEAIKPKSSNHDPNPLERTIAPSCCIAAMTERSCYSVLTTGNYWSFYKSQYADRKVRELSFETSDMNLDEIGPIVDAGAIETKNLRLLYAVFRMILDDVEKECTQEKPA